MTSRYRIVLSVTVDDDALLKHYEELNANGDLDLFPGTPGEWSSMLDLVDLVQRDIIIRSEVIEVGDAPDPYTEPRPSWLRRLFEGVWS